MPKISVIVPVYKVEAYLDRCVSSILAQTYRDFELILVDDGSPDCCGRLCEDYAASDSRIHVIHQENGGLSAARNSGIDWAIVNSDGEFLAFVDSDDWVDKTYLEQLYRAATESGCRLSVCGLYKTAGETRGSPAYTCQVMDGGDYYCSAEIHGGVTAVACSKLYHKSLFETLRYPVGKLHEDEFTTYRLVYAAEKVAVIPGALYAYFQNDAGIMRSKWTPGACTPWRQWRSRSPLPNRKTIPPCGAKRRSSTSTALTASWTSWMPSLTESSTGAFFKRSFAGA